MFWLLFGFSQLKKANEILRLPNRLATGSDPPTIAIYQHASRSRSPCFRGRLRFHEGSPTAWLTRSQFPNAA
jgi:hypothetical protein